MLAQPRTFFGEVNGTLLAMIEARKFSCDDKGYVDLRLRRSRDGKVREIVARKRARVCLVILGLR